MEISSNDNATAEAERALTVLAENAEDGDALDTLAGSDVLVPVPDDADDEAAGDPSVVALPVIEQPGGDPLVPVFTSEVRMAELLPSVSRYRLVPLGALAAQWPSSEVSLSIDASAPHGLTLSSQGVRALLARPNA
ncbi:SseB family protein [Streptomyces sp. NPDC050988]|uniref:SseB family protein n=1 Tax=Streptomyces sp. NPDC050988 TaxID=3365637 RepID=UPI0037AF0C5F